MEGAFWWRQFQSQWLYDPYPANAPAQYLDGYWPTYDRHDRSDYYVPIDRALPPALGRGLIHSLSRGSKLGSIENG